MQHACAEARAPIALYRERAAAEPIENIINTSAAVEVRTRRSRSAAPPPPTPPPAIGALPVLLQQLHRRSSEASLSVSAASLGPPRESDADADADVDPDTSLAPTFTTTTTALSAMAARARRVVEPLLPHATADLRALLEQCLDGAASRL